MPCECNRVDEPDTTGIMDEEVTRHQVKVSCARIATFSDQAVSQFEFGGNSSLLRGPALDTRTATAWVNCSKV